MKPILTALITLHYIAMRKHHFFKGVLLLTTQALFFLACSKSKDSTNNPNPGPGSSSNPLEGTYTMVSTQTLHDDTVNYIPYGGDLRIITHDTLTGYSFKGNMVIKKDSVSLTNVSCNTSRKSIRLEFKQSTGITTTYPSSSDIPGYADIYLSAVSTLKDSLMFSNYKAVNVIIPAGPYSPLTKVKYSFDNSKLTFVHDYYSSSVLVVNGDKYDYSARYKITTIFQKQ